MLFTDEAGFITDDIIGFDNNLLPEKNFHAIVQIRHQ
jgi:hypothetical protein